MYMENGKSINLQLNAPFLHVWRKLIIAYIWFLLAICVAYRVRNNLLMRQQRATMNFLIFILILYNFLKRKAHLNRYSLPIVSSTPLHSKHFLFISVQTISNMQCGPNKHAQQHQHRWKPYHRFLIIMLDCIIAKLTVMYTTLMYYIKNLPISSQMHFSSFTYTYVLAIVKIKSKSFILHARVRQWVREQLVICLNFKQNFCRKKMFIKPK